MRVLSRENTTTVVVVSIAVLATSLAAGLSLWMSGRLTTPLDWGTTSSATVVSLAHHHGGGADGVMTDGMASMDRAMAAVAMSGDADRDFAALMIPHHQGAVEMARAELLHGTDPMLKRLAQEIIVTQQSEIDLMTRRLAGSSAVVDAGQISAATAPVAAAQAQTSPVLTAAPATGPAVSEHDRVYTADQTSNTVSVIDPSSNTLLGVIRLGDPLPGSLSPLYRGQLLVHGLGFSPDHRTLVVVSVGSNSISLIDTATNTVNGVVYLGRSPHEAFFTPDGREIWVTVRGEDYVSVVDPVALQEVRRVHVDNGPGMVSFRPDGRYAFVCSSFMPRLSVVDDASYAIVAQVDQPSPFCPNIAASADGKEVWYTLKDVGQVRVIRAEPPFDTIATLDTGPITNHVNLVDNANGQFAYVTIGGLNQVKVYRRGDQPALVATIDVGDLPHGIWPSGDGSRVYAVMENGGEVYAIDTLSNTVIARIPSGQTSQALVYVPGAVPRGPGTDNLAALGEAGQVAHLRLAPPGNPQGPLQSTIAVNALGAVDLLQGSVVGLDPNGVYDLGLVTSPVAPYGPCEVIASFTANPAGAAVVQSVGPYRQPVVGAPTGPANERRYLVVTKSGSDQPVLVETD